MADRPWKIFRMMDIRADARWNGMWKIFWGFLLISNFVGILGILIYVYISIYICYAHITPKQI